MMGKRRWGVRKRPRNKARKPRVEVETRKVSIVIPATDLCHTGMALCLAHMIKHTFLQFPENLEALSINSYGTSIIPFSRQVLAKTSLEQGATHILWIDSDMEFPPDTLLRFLRRDEKLIAANCMTRRKPFRNTAQYENSEPVPTRMESSGLEKVNRVGFGVAWTAAEVFENISLPWFDFEWMSELSCFLGEDYTFFEKAKAAGYELFVDHDLSKEVHHIGTFAYNPLINDAVQRANVEIDQGGGPLASEGKQP
jgi:hypothetical protein